MNRMDMAREADRLSKAIHTPPDQRPPAQHELVNLTAEESLLVRLMRLDQDQFPVTTDPVPRIVESAQRLVDILVMEAEYKAGDRMGALLDLQEDVTAYRFLAEQKANPNRSERGGKAAWFYCVRITGNPAAAAHSAFRPGGG